MSIKTMMTKKTKKYRYREEVMLDMLLYLFSGPKLTTKLYHHMAFTTKQFYNHASRMLESGLVTVSEERPYGFGTRRIWNITPKGVEYMHKLQELQRFIGMAKQESVQHELPIHLQVSQY